MLACLGASLGLAPAHLRGPAARLALGRATRAFSGPRQAVIEERLASAFAPLHVVVENTSHGRKEDESHFKVVVVSEAFEGKRLVGRHRAVNAAVCEPDGSLGFHSLEIGAAKTPAEWELDSAVPPSPKCAGGDGRGMSR